MLGLLVLLLVAPPAAAQDDYLIGGGDTLQVNVWKNAELSQNVIVRPDGQITLPLIRDVKAQGLTAMQLGQVLAEKLSSFVNAPNVTVTVSGPVSFRVYTQGAIANGVHSLSAPITARQLLARAGGAAPDADLARAYILRGETRIPVDLSISPRAKQTPGVNPPLAPGDILAIPVRDVALGRVLVVGEVAQPHALPYVEGMTLLDAFLGAGGGTPAADLMNVRIARRGASGETTEIPVDVDELLKRGALEKNIVIAPGDIVIVPFRPPEERILVVGEVRAPRTIAFRAGLTLLDAFVEAGGGTEYADLDSVKVVRIAADGKKQELDVDLERILKKADLSKNLTLSPGDIVMVPR
ncbi:MAG: SLBB domain-containing protein [Candidatus Methylomirabilia bacterium]